MTHSTEKPAISTRHRELEIRQRNGLLEMIFSSDPEATQSAINPLHPEQLVMKNLQYLMGILLFIEPPKNILMLGVGAGSLIQFLRYYLPDSHITGIDYDQELLEIAHQQMMLPQADQRLSYIIGDARDYIDNCQQQYDLIVVDIFDGSQSPDWLKSQQFSQQLKSCLSAEGALAYNLLVHSEAEFNTFYKLLRDTFNGQTLCLETEEYENLLLYALNFTPSKRSMMGNIEHGQRLQANYGLPFSQILSVIYNINPVDSGVI